MSSVAFFAKSPDPVARFYAAVLGGQLATSEGVATIKTDLSEVLILTIPTEIAEEIEISTPPSAREDVAIKPIFEVANLASSITEVSKNGGVITSRSFAFDGYDHTDVVDPEGNVIQLRALSLN